MIGVEATTCYCYQCGKAFRPEVKDKWVFQRNVRKADREKGAGNESKRYFCSWRCMRDYDNRRFVPYMASNL